MISACGDGGPASSTASLETTVFDAALDTAGEKLRPKEAASPTSTAAADEHLGEVPISPPRRGTQGRHLNIAIELPGIAPTLDTATREKIAQLLAVPCLDLRHAARDPGDASRYHDEACVTVRALTLIRPPRSLCNQLLAAGQIAGHWGASSRWHPGGGQIRGSGPGA